MENHKMTDPFGPIGPLGAIARPGKPGDPVPAVDPEDIKAVWKDYDDPAARHPGERVAIGLRAIQASLLERSLSDNRVSAPRGKTPGADAMAVSFRAMALQLFMELQKQMEAQPLPWKKVELNDRAFRVAAQIPMQWQAPGRQENSFFFDIDDFIRRIGEAA